jgi:hypothetical protein
MVIDHREHKSRKIITPIRGYNLYCGLSFATIMPALPVPLRRAFRLENPEGMKLL